MSEPRYIPSGRHTSPFIWRAMGVPNGLRNAASKGYANMRAGRVLTESQSKACDHVSEAIRKAVLVMSNSDYDKFLTRCLAIAQWKINHEKA